MSSFLQMSKLLSIVAGLFSFLLIGSTWEISNEVILVEQSSTAYKFNLTLTHGLTMAVQDRLLDKFIPVIYNAQENAYYKRDPSLDTACGKMDLVKDPAELSTIVTASGYHRHLILVNGAFPGPPIVVPKNAQVEITVNNELFSDVVNIHWHGQEQRGSFFMDGVPGITECPIMPGESYTYKFQASKVGTHWYHAHTGVQRTEGLYGAFIVKDEINANLKESSSSSSSSSASFVSSSLSSSDVFAASRNGLNKTAETIRYCL